MVKWTSSIVSIIKSLHSSGKDARSIWEHLMADPLKKQTLMNHELSFEKLKKKMTALKLSLQGKSGGVHTTGSMNTNIKHNPFARESMENPQVLLKATKKRKRTRYEISNCSDLHVEVIDEMFNDFYIVLWSKCVGQTSPHFFIMSRKEDDMFVVEKYIPLVNDTLLDGVIAGAVNVVPDFKSVDSSKVMELNETLSGQDRFQDSTRKVTINIAFSKDIILNTARIFNVPNDIFDVYLLQKVTATMKKRRLGSKNKLEKVPVNDRRMSQISDTSSVHRINNGNFITQQDVYNRNPLRPNPLMGFNIHQYQQPMQNVRMEGPMIHPLHRQPMRLPPLHLMVQPPPPPPPQLPFGQGNQVNHGNTSQDGQL